MGHKWGMTWGVNSVKLCGNSEEQGSTDSIPGQLAQERGGGGGVDTKQAGEDSSVGAEDPGLEHPGVYHVLWLGCRGRDQSNSGDPRRRMGADS